MMLHVVLIYGLVTNAQSYSSLVGEMSCPVLFCYMYYLATPFMMNVIHETVVYTLINEKVILPASHCVSMCC